MEFECTFPHLFVLEHLFFRTLLSGPFNWKMYVMNKIKIDDTKLLIHKPNSCLPPISNKFFLSPTTMSNFVGFILPFNNKGNWCTMYYKRFINTKPIVILLIYFFTNFNILIFIDIILFIDFICSY